MMPPLLYNRFKWRCSLPCNRQGVGTLLLALLLGASVVPHCHGLGMQVHHEQGDYIGGVIAPGIVTAAEALFTRAAALPRVELVSPKQAIGSSTISAMQAGIVFGYIGLIEGIVARIQKELGEKATVVATGGYAELLAKETTVIDKVNPDVTLIGLRLIYLLNRA